MRHGQDALKSLVIAIPTRHVLTSEHELRSWLKDAQKVAAAGIRNPLRNEDFVGLKIMRNFQDKVSQSAYLIECEALPRAP